MWKVILNCVLLTMAAPVTAQPIYFECSMSGSDDRRAMNSFPVQGDCPAYSHV